jgi:hypothetical protein
MFARIQWEAFGFIPKIEECQTKEDFMAMVEWLSTNKVWFDVDFPSEV